MKLVSGADSLSCNSTARQELVHCILCGSSELEAVHPEKDHRYYYHCTNCSLIFSDRSFLLDRKEEKRQYLLHNNSIEESGYVDFLNRVIEPALTFLSKDMTGLDYGSGPGPTLSKILARQKITCFDYDPLFYPVHPPGKYDFIFSTECFEHFHKPKEEIENILALLKDNGLLCLMTERWESLEKFNKWYYKSDPTHVTFFHQDTFQYIMKKFGLTELYSDRNRVMILKKSS